MFLFNESTSIATLKYYISDYITKSSWICKQSMVEHEFNLTNNLGIAHKSKDSNIVGDNIMEDNIVIQA